MKSEQLSKIVINWSKMDWILRNRKDFVNSNYPIELMVWMDSFPFWLFDLILHDFSIENGNI